MTKNQIIELEITDITSEGAGVGRHDGMAVFVPFSAVGDKLSVKILKVNKSYAYGKIDEILVPSEDRITADCPVFGKCGGCDFRHLSYFAEAAAKNNIVKSAFAKQGLFPHFLPFSACDESEINRYRNKSQTPVATENSGEIISGFYANHSHRIIPHEDCLLQPVLFSRIIDFVKEFAGKNSISVYDEENHSGILRHIYLRRGHYSGEINLCVVATKNIPQFKALAEKAAAEFHEIKGVVLNINREKTNVILGKKEILLWGSSEITDKMCGSSVRISPQAFYQVNTPAAERLYSIAADFADVKGKTALELYCGAGTISMALAKTAKRVIGVEIVAEAVENARENAELNGIGNVEFYCADAGEFAAEFNEKVEVTVVDPPRKGCSAETIAAICRIAPEKVVMISCNPSTAARDCKMLEDKGFRAESVQGVDLFPRTRHVETVVLLSKLHAKQHIDIELQTDELDLTASESKATYDEIKAYVKEHAGLSVSSLYIAQVKQKCGIIERENYNKAKSDDAKQPKCPKDKEMAIMDALKYFKMI